ncbi:hypothetical protein CBM2598_U20049 [Cupriavidus taiwanensis]|nr:hypothetical protein CBM2598_U20049 [Cupriavidus taiwanensis]
MSRTYTRWPSAFAWISIAPQCAGWPAPIWRGEVASPRICATFARPLAKHAVPSASDMRLSIARNALKRAGVVRRHAAPWRSTIGCQRQNGHDANFLALYGHAKARADYRTATSLSLNASVLPAATSGDGMPSQRPVEHGEDIPSVDSLRRHR